LIEKNEITIRGLSIVDVTLAALLTIAGFSGTSPRDRARCTFARDHVHESHMIAVFVPITCDSPETIE
jgi:hypothetical protein